MGVTKVPSRNADLTLHREDCEAFCAQRDVSVARMSPVAPQYRGLHGLFLAPMLCQFCWKFTLGVD
jgi:hypothetical protein